MELRQESFLSVSILSCTAACQRILLLHERISARTSLKSIEMGHGDDGMESAYFTSRLALNKLLDEAAEWAAKKTSQEISAAVAAKCEYLEE